MQIFPVDTAYEAFVGAQLARNGLPPHGLFARARARAAHLLAGRCGLVIPGKEVRPANARNTASDLALWRTRYRSGPNGTRLVVDVRLIPTDDFQVGAPPAWYVKIDGLAQGDQRHSSFVASGGGLSLSDVFAMRQEIAVTAGASHTVELWTKNKCRIVGWYLHELERETLTTGTDTVADYTYLVPLGTILDGGVDGMTVTVPRAVREKMRGAHLAWNVDDPASPVSPANTTPTNIWDGSTARTSTTRGKTTPTQYRENYMEQFSGTPRIPVVCWVYGSKSATGNILVDFVGGGTTVTATITGGAAFYTATGNLLIPQSGGDKVDVLGYRASAGDGGSIYAAGFYPLIGS